MKSCLILCLLPLGALGALLGGYKPLKLDDPVVRSRVSPALESKGMLGLLPIVEVQQQQLGQVTKFRVYQGIPNHSGARICLVLTCPNDDDSPCKKPRRCDHTDTADTDNANANRPHSHYPPIRPAKAHLLGGEEQAGEEEVWEAAEFVVEHMNARSNSIFRLVSEGVSNVTKQVVNGLMYRFTLTLTTTQCRNSPANKGKQLRDCKIGDNPERQQCRVSVWRQIDGRLSLESQDCRKATPQPQPHLLGGGDGHEDCHVHIQAFRKFQADFNKLYSSPKEEGERFLTFCDNMKRIKALQDNERGSAVYGVNKFADISEKEFRKHYLTPKWDLETPRPWMTPAAKVSRDGVPDSFDWRQKGAVTPVKNQGSCGSCWAFSTTGNIEGQWAIKRGKLLSLSEQELVDCDKLDEGCGGGLPSNAYQAIMKLGGLETEGEYSYKGEDEKCSFNRSEVAVTINGAVNISSDEEEMKAWLYNNGPISIGINAMAMQFYFGGISHPWKIFCNPESLDHGVLIVGYDVTSSGEPYWIIKNSWGPSWGEKGYYLVYRGAGVCGLNRMCTSAVVKKTN